MKQDYQYIAEKTNKTTVRVVLFSFVIFIISIGMFVVFSDTLEVFVRGLPLYELVQVTVIDEMKSLSVIGLFYTGFIGGLFFIPIPQEIFFYYGLLQGNPIWLSLITVNAGYLASQFVNYLLGSRFYKVLLHVISKRKLYKARRMIQKHGGMGVFICNFLPLPAPLVTFALGIARYNITRLFFYTLLGTMLKYTLIIIFFMLVN